MFWMACVWGLHFKIILCSLCIPWLKFLLPQSARITRSEEKQWVKNEIYPSRLRSILLCEVHHFIEHIIKMIIEEVVMTTVW